MAPNQSDRRRFLLATTLTLLALPALWWANRTSDAGAPNVASVGIDVGDGAPGAGTPGAGAPGDGTPGAGTPGAGTPGAGATGAATPDPASPVAAPADPALQPAVQPATQPATQPAITSTPAAPSADEAAPVFLEGPAASAGAEVAEIAVPAAPAIVSITTKATYLRSITPKNSCLVAGVPSGKLITVVNLDNGRSVTCVATRTYTTSLEGLVLQTDAFSMIADLTDAPIPVEIRQ